MPETEEQKPLLLAHQTSIVTGAAKGIGRGIAIEMARAGAAVVIADVDDEGMEETKRLITDIGGICLSVHTDVQDTEQGRQLVDAALQQFGTIDILVNNAGINTPGARRILEISPESYDSVLQTNLRGSFFLSQFVAQKMIEHKTQGSILFTSSTHARIISMQPAYSASKAAIEMLVREIALDLAEYGIRVNAVAPGWIAVREQSERTNPFIPLGETGVPEHIAHAMVFLASRYASYITGQTLTVDGGFSLTHSHYWFKKGFLQR
ncbi:MAG TPA: SDR family oxidoreductase [Ktedonobacteraceae bacterium]|jgi:glucose 1-dehydrogenase